MRVLVTGASGFLGRAVAARIAHAGHDVTTLQRRPSGVPGVKDIAGSVTDAEVVRTAVQGQDAVVHLAAKVSLAGDPADFARVNIDGTRELLQAARAMGAYRFVQVSSPSVAHVGHSLVGVGAEPADPDGARGEYARTKATAELLALSFDSPSLAVLAVRPHIVWGPGDTQLVARVVDRARRHRLPLLDKGAALIDSTYIDNAADALAAALERAESAHGRALVVTNGEPRPVADLLSAMCRAAGVPAPSWHVSGRLARAAGGAVERIWAWRPGQDEPPMTRFLAEQLSTAHWFDQRETREALDWEPLVSIDEGMALLAQSYRDA